MMQPVLQIEIPRQLMLNRGHFGGTLDFDLKFSPKSPGRARQQPAATTEATIHKWILGGAQAKVKLRWRNLLRFNLPYATFKL
jgi:hypothetical protein